MTRPDDSGFSLVEILVAIGIFSVITVAFYQVLFSGADGSQTARAVSEVSSEARLGLNRMIRDTRQAANVTSATATSYTIDVDFDGSGTITQAPARNTPGGDYEQISFVFVDGRIYIEACNAAQGADCGEQKTVLIDGVSQIGSQPLFAYSSNQLRFDYNNNGVATKAEIESSGTYGENVTAAEILALLSDVDYVMKVSDENQTAEFFGHAQLRNKS